MNKSELISNSFKPEELVKVQGKEYPVVGGRLRLAHENEKLSIETSVVQYTPELAVIQATVTTEKGKYNGLGNASVARDKRLKDAILELAETRAIARALRFAGYGVEYTGYEEMPEESSQIQSKPKDEVSKPKSGDKANKETFNCESCGIEITKAEKTYSEHYYGKPLCKNCQKTYQKLK